MDFKDVAGHLFERSNAMQSFWSYYITISGALLAFFGSSRRSIPLTILLTVAFIGIAAANLGGMKNVAQQRVALRALLMHAGTEKADQVFKIPLPSDTVVKAYLDFPPPPPVKGVVTTHLCCDAMVIAAIWVLRLWPSTASTVSVWF